MKIMGKSLGVVAFLFLAGCGWNLDIAGRKVAGSEESAENREYKYKFEENGCSTGSQVFSSKEDMCNALLDEPRNNTCARRIREEYHKQNCG